MFSVKMDNMLKQNIITWHEESIEEVTDAAPAFCMALSIVFRWNSWVKNSQYKLHWFRFFIMTARPVKFH